MNSSVHHPYQDLPSWRYWRTAFEAARRGDWEGMYSPKFSIDSDTPIAAFGSCFAQHIARRLRVAGFRFLDMEPAPELLPSEDRPRFGYELFSCRTGNVYSSRQFRQLFARAFRKFDAPMIWTRNGRHFDAYRPTIEPDGLGSTDELLALRQSHERAVRRVFQQSRLLVFTLGLTETWEETYTGAVAPLAPGVVAGSFDPAAWRFVNLDYADVLGDMEWLITEATQRNPELKFLLTVSPVPLAATASEAHVFAATIHSKSVLRAVAGTLTKRYSCVDYFPSFELVTSAPVLLSSFAVDGREVASSAVDRVMGVFAAAHGFNLEDVSAAALPTPPNLAAEAESMRAVCDESRLGAAAK